MPIYISIVAVIVSSISLLVSYLNYRRDRAHAAVTAVKAAATTHKSREHRMSVYITNTGRRPLRIVAVGYRNLWKPREGFMIMMPDSLPKKLEEGDTVSCTIEYSEILNSGLGKKSLAYVFAWDSAGHEYRDNIAPLYKIILFRMLIKLMGLLAKFKMHQHEKTVVD